MGHTKSPVVNREVEEEVGDRLAERCEGNVSGAAVAVLGGENGPSPVKAPGGVE